MIHCFKQTKTSCKRNAWLLILSKTMHTTSRTFVYRRHTSGRAALAGKDANSVVSSQRHKSRGLGNVRASRKANQPHHGRGTGCAENNLPVTAATVGRREAGGGITPLQNQERDRQLPNPGAPLPDNALYSAPHRLSARPGGAH